MRGIYSHVSLSMRAGLRRHLQAACEDALRQRAAVSPRSSVAALDALLWGASDIIGPPTARPASRWLRKIGHLTERSPTASTVGLHLPFSWVELWGFEPQTPSMRTRCATRLRHSPPAPQGRANINR
jgi:hypothetical protein